MTSPWAAPVLPMRASFTPGVVSMVPGDVCTVATLLRKSASSGATLEREWTFPGAAPPSCSNVACSDVGDGISLCYRFVAGGRVAQKGDCLLDRAQSLRPH
jgi:hypothetical protein